MRVMQAGNPEALRPVAWGPVCIHYRHCILRLDAEAEVNVRKENVRVLWAGRMQGPVVRLQLLCN